MDQPEPINVSEPSTSCEKTKQKLALKSLKQTTLKRQQKKEKTNAKKFEKAIQKEQLINSKSEDEKINPEQEGQYPKKTQSPKKRISKQTNNKENKTNKQDNK